MYCVTVCWCVVNDFVSRHIYSEKAIPSLTRYMNLTFICLAGYVVCSSAVIEHSHLSVCACLQHDQMHRAGLSALLIAQYAELELLIYFVCTCVSTSSVGRSILLTRKTFIF